MADFSISRSSTPKSVAKYNRKRLETEDVEKPVKFKWSTDMVAKLIECLDSYKSEMDYKNIDFNSDKPAQYEAVRKALAQIFIDEPYFFGPDMVMLESLSGEEQGEPQETKKLQKKWQELKRKGYNRVMEKVKEVRQSFSKAVTSSTRSGNGRIVFDHYDALKKIYGGLPCTEPIACGVDSSAVAMNDSVATTTTAESDVSFITEMMGETGPQETRKRQKPEDGIPKLVDNKRRFLERNLSAAQRDKLLVEESKQEMQCRRDLVEAMKTSNDAFSEALKGISNTMQQLGAGICQSVQVLSQALVQPHAAVPNSMAMFPQNHPLQQQNVFDYGSYYSHTKDLLAQRNDTENNDDNSHGIL